MTCDDVELALSEQPPALSAEAFAHLATCASCQQTARLLEVASSPELSAEERAGLAQLPVRALTAWRAEEARRFSLRRLSGYAVAAALGALVASGVASLRLNTGLTVGPAVVAETSVTLGEPFATTPEWDSSADDETTAADESAFFDVSWPALTEGEVQ